MSPLLRAARKHTYYDPKEECPTCFTNIQLGKENERWSQLAKITTYSFSDEEREHAELEEQN